MTSQRPYVVLNAAMSLDGKIATRTGESRLSSEQDLRRVHKLRARVDAIMVGLGTVLADDPKLSVKFFRGRKPTRVIVDSNARIPRTAYVVKTARQTQTVVAVTEKAPQHRVRELERAGVLVVRSGKNRLVSLPNLMRRLWNMGIRELLLEGGGTLNWSMLEQGLVDEISVAISPRIIGGVNSVSLVDGRGVGRMDHAVRLKIESVKRYGTTLVLAYRVLR